MQLAGLCRDVLGLGGLVLLTAGLWLFDVRVAMTVLGAILLAGALFGAWRAAG